DGDRSVAGGEGRLLRAHERGAAGECDRQRDRGENTPRRTSAEHKKTLSGRRRLAPSILRSIDALQNSDVGRPFQGRQARLKASPYRFCNAPDPSLRSGRRERTDFGLSLRVRELAELVGH